MTFGFKEADKAVRGPARTSGAAALTPISRMCHALGVSQSGFFVWQEQPACRRQQQDMVSVCISVAFYYAVLIVERRVLIRLGMQTVE